ncbi:MAG: LPS-assembly protein LptD [Muribaculaceae bacterium]|nr:LPS-assembly protein LptD [Muribaculaceae bacterium]
MTASSQHKTASSDQIALPDSPLTAADSLVRPLAISKNPAESIPQNVAPAPLAAADSLNAAADSLQAALPDSLKVKTDTLTVAQRDSLASLYRKRRLSRERINPDENKGRRIVREKGDLETQVDFAAADSLVLFGRNEARLYGNSNITYGNIKLKAAEIQLDTRSNTVYAVGVPDSTGALEGKPVFTDNGTDYESETMRYNFSTQKGFITNVVTKQGEGFLTGGKTKKIDDNTFYIENGRYTTCEDHEHPHFWMQLTQAKVRAKKDIVSGPAYMVLEGLPLPLALPFGYFPFKEKYSSGILFPTFGEDYQKGFYMRKGGYYLALSDNIDLALTGEIYTRGSWGIQAQSAYVKRYKFSGSFNVSYITTVYGDKGMPDYSKQTNFQVIWNHSQDPKSNPNLNFSASVNFSTSGYSRNDIDSYYNNSFTENTKSSSVNLTYRPPGSKWSISATANITQRTQDSTLAVSFPNINVTMSQIAPFKRKNAVGKERWYEKIKLSYSGQFSNSLTAKQNVFFKKSLIRDWRNGMKHSVPISATFQLFKYINITPSLNITDRMYTQKIKRSWDPNASVEVCDTSYSFYNVLDFSGSLSLDTKIYGFFQPLPFLGDKVKMIRHVLTPTLTFSASPDFSAPFWGIYGSYSYTDKQGVEQQKKYSYFPNSLYGVPGMGKSGIVTLSLANNLEMKVKSDKDSIGEKKISLIENFTISQSYNFAADSLNWSNVQMNLMLRLTKSFNLSISSTWDPYTFALSPTGNPVRVNIPRWKAGKGWVRLSSAGTSFSYTFNNDTFKKKGNKSSDKKTQPTEAQDFASETADMPPGQNRNNKSSDPQFDDDGYMKWDFPWSLSVNYSIGYAYGEFDKQKMEYKGRLTQNLSFSGSFRPTKNWNFSFSASFNFETKKLAYMNCNISRDLHCFVMTASFVPIGPYKSYNFHIAIKSSMLKDIKYDRRSSNQNGVTWY